MHCWLAGLLAGPSVCWLWVCRKQEETIRELAAALEAKDQELKDAKQQAAAEADAAVLERMQVPSPTLSSDVPQLLLLCSALLPRDTLPAFSSNVR